MKKILNYWMNLALVAIIILAGGLSSCSDNDNDDKEASDDNNVKELINQIKYNTAITDIKSVVWERNSQGIYSIYLSPRESVNSLEELGSDFMKIEARNIFDFSTQTDEYSLSYSDVSVDENSVSSGKASVDLDFKLDLKAAVFDIKGSIKVGESENTLDVKYNGPARRLMPVVSENQVNYNGEKYALKSSAWKRNSEGVYTFYISSEDINVTENISGKVITLETNNPLNFDVAKDAFTLKYGGIEINENSAKNGYTKVDVKIGFDPVTATFAVSSEAQTENGDVFMASYSGKTTHIRPQASDNKICLNNEVTDINSVLWENDKNGMLNIYLSPRKGLQSYEDVVKENDYMLIKTSKADGVLKENYEIKFKNVTLGNDANYIDSEISAVLKDGKLVMNIYALTNEGIEINAAYNGTAEKIRPIQLHNQWQIDREKAQNIYSAIEWRTGDLTSFYLCSKKGIASPDDINGSDNIKIVVPKDYPESISLKGNKDVKIVCGNIESDKAKNVEGSIKISKNNLHESIKIELDAMIDGKHVRAAWTGKYSVGYDSCNKLRIVTPDEKVSEVLLSKVFMYSNGATNTIAFGTKDNPSGAKDLMEGQAVQINLTDLLQNIDLEKSTNYRIRLFDYGTYNTYDSSDLKTKGILNVWNDGKGMLYLMIDASINGGAHIKAEWYGKVTMVKDFDITPVKPFHPYFKITQKDGEVTKDVEIIELQVRNDPNFQSNITGAKFNAYVFYFVNKHTAASGINDISATPVLAVNKDYIGKGEIDITKGEKIFDFQYLPFNSPGISSPVGNGSTTEKGSLTVVKQRRNWIIKFSIYDYGDWWGHGQPSGTKATFTAEWEGPETEFEGK